MIDIPDSTTEERELSPAVAAVRAELMNGLATVEVFAEALGKRKRQIQNYLSEGMPHVHYGQTPYIKIDKARDWLVARSKPD